MSTALWSAGAAGGKATKKSLALVNIDLQGSNAKIIGPKQAGRGHRESMSIDDVLQRSTPKHLQPPWPLPDCECRDRLQRSMAGSCG